MPEKRPAEDAAEELYGLPPGDFTKARDERANALRADGERETAAEVKALRKPTVAAWALNQLSRQRKKDVDALLRAGEELRAAQEELLGGGDRAEFQEAAARERELVGRLSADAVSLASEAGERSGGLQQKVADTLHAAALDEGTAEELRAGRLAKEREAIGGFGAMTADSVPAPSKRSSKPTKRGEGGGSKARAADAQRKQRLAGARTDERHARRELEAAERALQHAKERADAAAAHAKEAVERASKTAERVKEATRAQAAARKAHARAQRDLDKADSGSS
jgi:hypothetical protein